ncbi:MAG: class I mannose-6-phosphate isomerase [Bacteroidales bacterium]|nr:class I mannose-6-phosphate isomerase [Bacteroidales bacterium]
MLYPLKFKPILKEKIWGGNKLHKYFGKGSPEMTNCGESWEISGLQDDYSIVSNGFLEGNNIQELIEIYMGDLVGEKVYEKFGDEFPLLIKFIDAQQDLSIQVHPNDELAMEKHNAYGKTEMWYVLDAESDSRLVSGFKRKTNPESFAKILENGNPEDYLNFEKVKKGDLFFIPAGRVHAIGAGILLTEIQQTSDVTYRLYDYNRKDDNGNLRDLHIDLAMKAIDFTVEESYKTNYKSLPNLESRLIHCEHFNTNILEFDKEIIKEYNFIDSFVIYICLDGSFEINCNNEITEVKKGETVLIPAELKSLIINPLPKSVLLEVYYL